jgi:hypothetical protein
MSSPDSSIGAISKEEVQAFYEGFLRASRSGNITSLERIDAGDDYLLARPNGDTSGKKEPRELAPSFHEECASQVLKSEFRLGVCTQKSCSKPGGVDIESRREEDIMQAAVVPAVSSSWQIKDVPQPQPGPNQVLVKMHASGICYTHVHETLGHIPGQFPRILGHEPVGEIVAVAPDPTSQRES